MRIHIRRLGVVAALAVFPLGSVAAAQEWESGDTGAWEQPPAPQQQPAQSWGQPQQQPQGWPQPQQTQGWGQPQAQEQPPGWGTAETAETTEGTAGTGSDHSSVVGHFGVGFFGVASLPFGDLYPDAAGGEVTRIAAPTVGIRYWLSERLGVDASIGLGYRSESAERGDSTLVDESAVGFALHAGLPIVFMHEEHYKFLVTPEITFGITDGSEGDVLLSGLLFELGARIGAEIHFGFIDLPQLALQGTVGAHLRYESTVYDEAPGVPTRDSSRFSLGTSVQAEPWDIFVGSITAIYYLR